LGKNTGVPLQRIAWTATVVVCAIAAVLLVLNDYTGYSLVVGAVGLSAAVNLT
jgi:hypothetical protein